MPKPADPPKSKRAEREAQLAQALRANLKRRKAGTAKSAPDVGDSKGEEPD